jgi:hypothetical protein
MRVDEMGKGLSKFLMKQIYLIIAILSIVLIVNQVVSLTKRTAQDTQLIDMRSQSNDILNTLVSSTDCLALEYNGQLVLDEYTLTQYAKFFSDVEPNCIKSYDYGYSVKVEKFNNTVKRGDYWSPKIPVGNRDMVLILDSSWSMRERSSKGDPYPKIKYAKDAAKELIKCASDTDRISILIFGPDGCGVIDLLASKGYPTFVQLDSDAIKDDLSALVDSGVKPDAGTPVIASIERAISTIKTANPDKNRLIIMLTDGIDTCCDACRGGASPGGCPAGTICVGPASQILGTCCCLMPCRNAACEYESAGLDYLLSENISITTIFLGNDPFGAQQMVCIADKTNGESFSVDDPAILPDLFCELVSKKEPITEETQDWIFGAQSHSEGELLRTSFTSTSPVLIRINDTEVQPGLLTLTVYDGELEELVGFIRNVCENGGVAEKEMVLSSPVNVKDDKICMTGSGREICKRVLCDSEIDFDGVNQAGYYTFKAIKRGDTVEVIV